MNKTLVALSGAAAAVALALGVVAQATPVSKPKQSFMRNGPPPVPADNALTPARIDLGWKLFFDPRLSGSGWMSCASCHNPALGWGDGLPLAVGQGMKTLNRHTPTILNSGYNKLQMWDGRFASLEEQALGPITSPDEMNADMRIVVERLQAIEGYKPLFAKAYPGEGINDRTIAKAIASYERTVISGEAPFDRWLKGDTKAIGAAAKRGFELFNGKANCVACHEGPNFTDDGFHNIGVKPLEGFDDPGRYAKVKVKLMRGAHKTPSLRDVALTAPYMHNGAYATLRQVVEMYNRGGDHKENLDPNMKELHLTDREVDDVVEFMRSLTGKATLVSIPQLPY